MIIIKEVVLDNGRIVRLAEHNGKLIVRIYDIKYVNKVITEDNIRRFYDAYVINMNKHKKSKSKMFEVVPYDKYKQIIIDDYALRGIPYKEDNKLKLLE